MCLIETRQHKRDCIQIADDKEFPLKLRGKITDKEFFQATTWSKTQFLTEVSNNHFFGFMKCLKELYSDLELEFFYLPPTSMCI
ncbi:1520_t:CDS:1, partial [Acaulospora morrowiae]